MAQTVDRRTLIVGGTAAVASTALIIPLMTSSTSSVSLMGVSDPALQPAPGTLLGAYLKVDSNNIVTVIIGPTEMGQGIMSGLAQLVAAELMLNWQDVRGEHSVTTSANVASYANPLFHAQITGGSTSMRGWYLPMRQAAAKARALLLQAASQLYGGDWTLATGGRVTQGSVFHSFSELVSTAAGLPLPGDQPLTDPNSVIGTAAKRLDIPAKINGSAIFGMDVMLPNMVFATSVHCPTLTGTVKTMPAAPTGITLVNLGSAVGVVGKHSYAALQAATSIASKIVWNLPASTAALDSTTVINAGKALATSTSVTPQFPETLGDAVSALTAASKKIDATYNLPFLAHATMEVLNCTVNPIYDGFGMLSSLELWVPTQGQQFVIPAAAAASGLASAAITVHTPYLGGGFGRKIESDYVVEAVKIALAVKKPVKLMWSRPQDFANDKYRPCSTIRVQAGMDGTGAMSALLYRNVSPSINQQKNPSNPEDTGATAGAVGLPYTIPNRRIEYVPNPTSIPLGYWRSVGESYNTFAVESAIDELALLAGVDPLQFRLNHLSGDARAYGVLNAVKTLSNWGRPATGAAQGVAFLKGFGSYIAMVAEVGKVVNATTGAVTVKVNKISVALDCGIVVNPDSVLAQIQGGVAHGLAATLWQQATFNAGKPVVTNYNNYRVVKLSDMPALATLTVTSSADPGGVGETPVPCVAPAVANAWAKLTGTRVRNLPFYPGSTMGGL